MEYCWRNRRGIAGSIAAVMLLFTANAASAAVFQFGCITNNLAGDCTIAETAFQVEVTDAGAGFVDFTFTRSGPDQANLSEVYFDDGTLLGISTITSSSGVVFTGGSASPPDLPGGDMIGFEVSAGFLAEANNPAPKKGVNDNADWLTITFALINGKTFADTIAAMGNDLLIGIHVTAFASGGSESLVSPPPGTVIPVPAAVWLFGSALGLLGWVRRRSLI
jgi:hypothetical protein